MSRDRFWTAFVTGVLLLIPVVVVFVVLGQVYKVAAVIAEFGEDLLGLEGIAEAIAFNGLAILIVLVIVVGLGLLAERGILKGRFEALDRIVAAILPGYVIIKAKVMGTVNAEAGMQDTRPVLVRQGNMWRIGLETERSADGTVVVFLPQVPNPQTGYAMGFRSEDVQCIEISPKALLETFEFYGRGLSSIVDNAIADTERSGSDKNNPAN